MLMEICVQDGIMFEPFILLVEIIIIEKQEINILGVLEKILKILLKKIFW